MQLFKINNKNVICTVLWSLSVFGCGSGGGASPNDVPPVVNNQPVNETPPPANNNSEVVQPETPEVPAPTAPDSVPFEIPDEISPQTAIAAMQVGINLGNTLDAPHEGDWALPAKESFIVDFKSAGFKHVRIPVTWHEHVQQTAPYEVDSNFMARVEEIVDWALANDFYVILNAHHEKWLKENYQLAANKARFDSIWQQIAARFKEKPAKLMYEILNEPYGMTMSEVEDANSRILQIIRNENPNRLVVFSGNGYTPVDSMLEVEIPGVLDKFLIANFHSYDPWQFAGQCQRSWGTVADKEALREIYQRASDWSIVNQIPVMVNEFGSAKFDFTMTQNVCDLDSRLAYLAHHVTLIKEFGFAGSFWDDGLSFSSYNRENNTWGPEKDVLVSQNQ